MLNEANDEIFRKELEDISQDLSKATRLRASLKLSMGFDAEIETDFRHRINIGGDYFKDLAPHLCKFYSGETDFKGYITLLSFSFYTEYFQPGRLVLCIRRASWCTQW